MKGGYKIYWTKNALSELDKTIEYLETNFSDKQIKRLFQKVEDIIELISKNPDMFQKSDYKSVHRVTILKFNTIYYRVKKNKVEILSFFSNRQSPKRRKM